jgi:hypothetical protein
MRLSLVKKGWIAVAVGVGLVVVLFLSCGETVPKKDQTLGNISSLGLQVHNFYETNHRLPASLEELNPDPRFRNDAWGRPMTYTITTSNSYVLRSLGPTGKPGQDSMAYAFNAADLSGTPVQ